MTSSPDDDVPETVLEKIAGVAGRNGMSVRAYIATSALQSMMMYAITTPDASAQWAVKHADALIAALKEEPSQ